MGSLNNAGNQREKVLERLRSKGRLSTIEARNELYVMSIAARIFELKERGHNIVTNKVRIGNKKIAEYVLLAGNENAWKN